MRHYLGWVIVLGLLASVAPTSRAHAQFAVSFGYPGYGNGYGYGYGSPGGYGNGYGVPGYGYSGYSGVYGANAYAPATSYYGSGYSTYYAAPGTTAFVPGGYMPYVGGAPVAVGGYGYGNSYGAGYPGAYGYGNAPSFGSNTRIIPTGPFMGMPRAGGGLVRVPY